MASARRSVLPPNFLDDISHEEMGCYEDFFGGALAVVPVRGLRRQSRWL